MRRVILTAGTIIASTIGFALAGFMLSEALKHSWRKASLPSRYKPQFAGDFLPSSFEEPPLRGYDTPELHREDTVARIRTGRIRDAG